MKVLLAGASGATGRLLLKQLLDRGHSVRVIVRSEDRLPKVLVHRDQLQIILGNILEIGHDEMVLHTQGCNAIVSCLGHNLSLKGIYGQPRKLVTDATRNLCEAVEANKTVKPVKYILMNTAGNSNRDINEPISGVEKMLIGLIRHLLPPHADNEEASDFLRTSIGQHNDWIEWVVVRPDTLTNEEEVTRYDLYPSPIRSALFNPGKTSRINVAHFMSELISDEGTWEKWKGQMPVIYNSLSQS